MDSLLPRYKFVHSETGRLFCLLGSLRVVALPSGGLCILPLTWELLRVLGSSAVHLTEPMAQPRGPGPVSLPRALRLKAAQRHMGEVLWGRKKPPPHTQHASKALHVKSLLVDLVGWKSRLSSYSAFKICMMLSISRFGNFIKKDLNSEEKSL